MSSDPLPIAWSIVLILVLVFLNGFFVAAEFAMVKVRSSRIDTLVQDGNRKARFASLLTSNLDAYLSACQLGITLASLGLGWVGEPTVSHILEPLLEKLRLGEVAVSTISFIVAFSVITVFHIVLGELAPKTYAIRKAEPVTLWTAVPLIAFHKVMYPFIYLLNGMANGMLKSIGIEPAAEHESAHTEEEIRILMKESHKSGLIDNTELTLVDNIFEFAETHAREIMIPRTEMICLYANLPFEENQAIALKEMHTRYPLCEKDKDNIIGFIHIKDLLKVSRQHIEDIREIARPMTTVPDSMHISTLLKLMQKKKTQIAILIDEYGGTSGLVTLEDIMEEIVGEIQDEFDEERPDVEPKEDGSHSVNGMMLIEAVNSCFGTEIESDDYDTIGGWMYAQLENPPTQGQRVVHPIGFEFIIEETDHLRISRIQIRKHAVNDADEELLIEDNLQAETG
ncbi:HlyC/CorC family transporter [Paenibacillus lycopersici]|uniref:HlyC/CorC family transporter n=1 Tax=Paenibacillus lycopersici TaxID=2704462 RepID=A0A6C0G3P4_9BACL|nr:hemolysin family protein [Paenibacillus lycopersici]QHT62024.1 HlyC/CorC family transporter [Paenibacillus lycopersici]